MSNKLFQLCIFFAVAALLGYLSAPRFLGFSVIPLGLSIIFAILAGPKIWRAKLSYLKSPLGRLRLKILLGFIFSVVIVLVSGHSFFAKSWDVSPERFLGLSGQSLDLLKKINKDVTIEVHMGPQDPKEPRIRELLKLYSEASEGRIDFTFINPQNSPSYNDDIGPKVVQSDTATINSQDFMENISPVNEEKINGALKRLMLPSNRLVYFISTFGEKMAQDKGPGGLSGWAADLSSLRVTVSDYYWADETFLPTEASVIIIAGPRAPLGDWREEQLLKYIKNGGRVMIMADPFVVAFSEKFWRSFGIIYPDGLLIDPEINLAGTSDVFIITQNYPYHSITASMGQLPVLWPLAGVFQTISQDQAEDMQSTVYALAVSSQSSWLEKDGNSYRNNNARYKEGEDIAGPLPLAVAAEIKKSDQATGALVAVADSDFAVNSFHGFSGNREFCLAAVSWLLDGKETFNLPKQYDAGQNLIFSYNTARLVFWLPVVLWPVLVLFIWYCYRRKRRGQ